MLPLATGPPAALNGPAAEPPVAVQPQVLLDPALFSRLSPAHDHMCRANG